MSQGWLQVCKAERCCLHWAIHLNGDHEALSPQLAGCSNEPMFSYENAAQTEAPEAACPPTVV